MHIFMRLMFAFIFSVISFNLSVANSIIIRQSNSDGCYHTGEQIKVMVRLSIQKPDSLLVRVRRNFSSRYTEEKMKYYDGMEIFNEKAKDSSTIIIDVITKTDTCSTGMIINPERFRPATLRPSDLITFWREQKMQLRSQPMAIKSVPVDCASPGFECSDVEISCADVKPARGYLVKPVKARKKSLPIVIYFHAAGVSASWARSQPGNALRYAKMGSGAIGFDLNAHGLLNGQSDEYYKDLESGELKNYGQIGLESKDSIYFRGMYLRLLRTIDYLTSLPEWDGKRILVVGESQGGGQALAAAGLDERVTAAVVTVPAMCDWGGALAGRRGSWPYPYSSGLNKTKMLRTLPYFDVAHLIKGTKATIVAEVGLIDYTCPSSCIYAALNGARGRKIIYPVPYRAHHLTQIAYADEHRKLVDTPKEQFIEAYLK